MGQRLVDGDCVELVDGVLTKWAAARRDHESANLIETPLEETLVRTQALVDGTVLTVDRHDLGARRLGHALRLGDDERLWSRVRDEGIAVETALTSNLQTGAVREIAEHPFGWMHAEGFTVTLNTDDPGVSAIDLVHEMELAAATFGLDEADLLQLTLNAAEAAFCDAATRRMLSERIRSSWSAPPSEPDQREG